MGERLISVVAICVLILALLSISAAQPGAEIFDVRCAKCHGADGAGNTNAAKTFNGMPDLRARAVQAKSDKELFETIGRGSDHKKYPHVFLQTGLTQGQVSEIVAHLRQLAKK